MIVEWEFQKFNFYGQHSCDEYDRLNKIKNDPSGYQIKNAK